MELDPWDKTLESLLFRSMKGPDRLLRHYGSAIGDTHGEQTQRGAFFCENQGSSPGWQPHNWGSLTTVLSASSLNNYKGVNGYTLN
jgi:hypothetical protein